MNYSFLFDKDDQRHYAILRSILQRATVALDKRTLSEQWDLTAYQINKAFEMINLDLKALDPPVPAYLDESTRGFWRANNITTYTLQQLALTYLHRASAFLVLEYHFFYSNQMTRREYIKRQSISTPAFYSVAAKLNTDLEAAGFFTPTGSVTDPEFTTRLSLFELYYTMYAGVAPAFPELDALVDRLFTAIGPLLGTLKPTQTTKLRLFMKLWLLRVQNSETFQAPLLDPTLVTPTGQTLQRACGAVLASTIPVSATELDYLYLFLIAQGYLPLPDAPCLAAAFPQATTLTDSLMAALSEQGGLFATQALDQTELRETLYHLHLQFTTFFIEPTTFIDPEAVTFFRELYPGFDIVLVQFIQTIGHTTALPLTTTMATNLYFSYMFALISAIPPQMMNDQVYVCVDFSQGPLYTDYIITTLNAFTQAHLVIQTTATAKTDIYISDFRATGVRAAQVIWQNPPTPNDWSQLADMILMIRQAKTSRLFKKEGAPHDA
ncbi:hypothetical protein [Lacticaseibacillus absianus]|uniref:hypothetical protein n=1 Tax=Lacticaseibacillus absianus TaxID=2729623 RepID=UPI0015C8B10B|nr:hypothetical protein [Lacticaseibacillus absianus]